MSSGNSNKSCETFVMSQATCSMIAEVKDLDWLCSERSGHSYHLLNTPGMRGYVELTTRCWRGTRPQWPTMSYHQQRAMVGNLKKKNEIQLCPHNFLPSSAVIHPVKCACVNSICSTGRYRCQRTGLGCTDPCSCSEYAD
jgi:hypothetical protein